MGCRDWRRLGVAARLGHAVYLADGDFEMDGDERHAAAALRPVSAAAEDASGCHHAPGVTGGDFLNRVPDLPGGDDVALADNHSLTLDGPGGIAAGESGERFHGPPQRRILLAQPRDLVLLRHFTG